MDDKSNFSNFLTFLSLVVSFPFFLLNYSHLFPLKNSQPMQTYVTTYLSLYSTKSSQTFLTLINNNLSRFCLSHCTSMIVQQTTPSPIGNVDCRCWLHSIKKDKPYANTWYNISSICSHTDLSLINNNLFSFPLITHSHNNK